LVVDVTEEEVSLVLENRRAEAARPGTGLGRGAIAHRAQAVGGQAESGAIDADRWRVQARLPAHPPSPTTSKEAHALAIPSQSPSPPTTPPSCPVRCPRSTPPPTSPLSP